MIVISGPSSVGKNVAIAALCSRYGARFATPITTRGRRSEETSAVDYDFVDVPRFQDLIRSRGLDEWDFALGHYYGFHAGTFAEGPPTVTHALARMALRIRGRFSGVTLVFLRPANDVIQTCRLEARFPDAEDRRARLDHWREELRHAPMFDHEIEVTGGNEVLEAPYEAIWAPLARGA